MRVVAALVLLGAVLVLPARAVELTLVATNVTMPAGSTFQMPLTGSDASNAPLTYTLVSISNRKVTGVLAPSSNPSLLMNVSGYDATNNFFSGDLVLQLFADLVTNTTEHIISLVNSNFYNGLTFHRVIQNFIAQGGDPNGNGTGGSGVTVDDEFVTNLTFNGFGQIALANSGPDTQDSQFFITDVDLSVATNSPPSPQELNFKYTLFGQLTRGFDIMTKIMETPVTYSSSFELSKPITPVVINSASIFYDTQDAVLRLTAAASFTGAVSVTVRAMNPSRESAQQTFRVTVVPQTINNPPFLEPIPSSLTVTQNVGGGFLLSAADLENNPLVLSLVEQGTGIVPTNIYISYIPIAHNQGQLWLYSDMTVTGTQDLVIGVTDNFHFFNAPDSQKFALTILPISPTPTMSIVPLSGTIKAVPNITGGVTNINSHGVTNITATVTNKFNDSVSIAGNLIFNANSDMTFGSNDVLRIAIGSTNNLVSLSLMPDFNGWHVRNGVVTWKNPKGGKPPSYISNVWGSKIAVSVKLDSGRGKFKIQINGFDFPSEVLTNPIQVGITLGNDYGKNIQPWTEKKPGVFVAP